MTTVNTIPIGISSTLSILRWTSVGLYLGHESGEEVLLPNKYCPENYEIGQELAVFVYRDYADRKIATNIIPKIQLYQFALLKVSAIEEVGAFMDWGLEKELLVPFKEQRQKMEEGRSYIVYLALDEKTDRLYASNKTDQFLQNEEVFVREGEEVDILIHQKTEIGYNVIINHQHKGLVYQNEIFKTVKIGDQVSGYIKKIREDNKIDVSLHPMGYEFANDPNSQIIMEELRNNEGFLSLTDKSPPEKIYDQLGMSKKAFKKAIGALYKQQLIEIKPGGITLVD